MYLFCEMIRYNTSALNHLPQKTTTVHIAIIPITYSGSILSISKTGKLILYIYIYIGVYEKLQKQVLAQCTFGG